MNNPQLSNPVDAVPNTAGRAEIIDENCICFNVLMMTFGAIFEYYF